MGTQMDDVQIIDVNEDGEEEVAPVVHRSSLGNQDLGFMRQTGVYPTVKHRDGPTHTA